MTHFQSGRPILGGTGRNDISFRRTDQDRRPPSRILTGSLLGDPDPDRFARSEALRAHLGLKAEMAETVPAKLIPLLRALQSGPVAPVDLCPKLNLVRSTVDARTKVAVLLELVERVGVGRNRRIALTKAGRAALEGLPQ